VLSRTGRQRKRHLEESGRSTKPRRADKYNRDGKKKRRVDEIRQVEKTSKKHRNADARQASHEKHAQDAQTLKPVSFKQLMKEKEDFKKENEDLKQKLKAALEAAGSPPAAAQCRADDQASEDKNARPENEISDLQRQLVKAQSRSAAQGQGANTHRLIQDAILDTRPLGKGNGGATLTERQALFLVKSWQLGGGRLDISDRNSIVLVCSGSLAEMVRSCPKPGGISTGNDDFGEKQRTLGGLLECADINPRAGVVSALVKYLTQSSEQGSSDYTEEHGLRVMALTRIFKRVPGSPRRFDYEIYGHIAQHEKKAWESCGSQEHRDRATKPLTQGSRLHKQQIVDPWALAMKAALEGFELGDRVRGKTGAGGQCAQRGVSTTEIEFVLPQADVGASSLATLAGNGFGLPALTSTNVPMPPTASAASA